MQAHNALSDPSGPLHLESPADLTDVTPNQRTVRNALTDFLGHQGPEAPVGLNDIITPNPLAILYPTFSAVGNTRSLALY